MTAFIISATRMWGCARWRRVAARAVSINEPARALVTNIAILAGIASEREEPGNRVERLDPGLVQVLLRQAGLTVIGADRYAMFYRHAPGPAMHLLSRSRLFPVTRAAIAAFNDASRRHQQQAGGPRQCATRRGTFERGARRHRGNRRGSGFGEGQGGASGYIEGIVPELLADPRIERLTAYVARSYRPAADWSHPEAARSMASGAFRSGQAASRSSKRLFRSTHVGIGSTFCSPLATSAPWPTGEPNVLALHAIQHFLLNDDIGRVRSAYVRFAVPRSARSADIVVAVSEALRRGRHPCVWPRSRPHPQRADGAFTVDA